MKLSLVSTNKNVFDQEDVRPCQLVKCLPDSLNQLNKERDIEFNSVKEKIKFYMNRNSFKTYKSCPSFLSMIKECIVMRIPCDCYIALYPDSSWEWRTPTPMIRISEHTKPQHSPFMKNHSVLKFQLDWYCRENARFTYLHPHLHEEKRWEVNTGILDTRLNNDLGNVIVFFEVPRQEKMVYIRRGTPLCYLLPLREKSENHKINYEYQDSFSKPGTSWTNFSPQLTNWFPKL